MIPYSKISKAQSRDTGMAMVLIMLLLANFFLKSSVLNILSIPVLILTMSIPIIFKPLAVVWFGFSHILGAVMSRFILSSIFIIVVTPLGLLINTIRRDPLRLKAFKKTTDSVFITRDHTFSKKDIDYPY